MNQRLLLGAACTVLVATLSIGALRVRYGVAASQYHVALRLQGRDQARYLERAVDLEPGLVPARLRLARDLMALNQDERALTQVQQLIHMAPGAHLDLWELRQRQGELLLRLGHVDTAAEAFRKAILIRPAEARTHLFMARALEQLNRTGDAVAEYRAAIRLAPANEVSEEDCYVNLYSLFRRTHQTSQARALARDMDRSPLLKMDEYRVAAQEERAAGHVPSALADLKLAMAANPYSERPHLEAADLLEKMGQTRTAVDQAEQGAALAPNDPGARLALASALETDKQWDRAVRIYQAVENVQPQAFANWVAAGLGPQADNPAAVLLQEHLEMLINPDDVRLMGPDSEPGIQQAWYAGDSGEHHVDLKVANALFLQGALAQTRHDYTGAGQRYQNALHFIPPAESLHNTAFSNRLREAIETGIDSVLQSQLTGTAARPA